MASSHRSKKELFAVPQTVPSMTQDNFGSHEETIEAYSLEASSREQLPIELKAREVLYAIEHNQTTIVVGETGSGKSTKLPQLLLATGRYAVNGKKIGLTLPKRVSVINIAKRLAQNMQVQLGEEVGYAMRFDRLAGSQTEIKVLTDGMLVQEMLSDPLLSEYSVLIIDDCHDRSMYTDLILGLLKKIRRKRGDLKIVISSATIETNLYFNFFNELPKFPASVVHVQGRCFPVELYYLESPTKDYVQQAVQTAVQIHAQEQDPNSGNVLVFLTGQDEINAFCRLFEQTVAGHHDLTPFQKQSIFCQACYASLPMAEQVKIFEPAPFNTRKVIVSTNIAETSITIEGIVFVIDSCFTKAKYFNPTLHMEQLMVIPASKASCSQRAGRSGRVKPGKCYRLCTKDYFENCLPDAMVPEIQRTDPTQLILQLKGLGVRNILEFDYLSGPTRESFMQGLELLYNLGALDDQAQLTQDTGVKMVELAIEPRLAAAILIANDEKYRVCEEVITTASLMQFSQQLFSYSQADSAVQVSKNKKKYGVTEGDHITLLNIFNLYQSKKSQPQKNGFCRELKINQWALDKAAEAKKALKRQLKSLGVTILKSDDYDDPEAILKSLATAFFSNVAQRQSDGSYTNACSPGASGLQIHPSSVLSNLKPRWVLYNELVVTHSRKYMCEVSAIEVEWLFELVPHVFVDRRKQMHQERHQQESQRNMGPQESLLGKRTTAQTSLGRALDKAANRFQRKGLNMTQSVDQASNLPQAEAQDDVGQPMPHRVQFVSKRQKAGPDQGNGSSKEQKKSGVKRLVGLSFVDEDDY